MWSSRELPLDMRKVAAELKRRPPAKGSNVYVLTGSGSYSPPHRMHIEMFEKARAHLESTEKKTRVVGGFIVPSSERYVNRKLGKETISLRDRVEMSRLVCLGSTWIEACGWGIASSSEVAFRVQQCLHLSGLEELYKCKFQVLQLFGADTIIRMYGSVSEDFDEEGIGGSPIMRVVLGRPGCAEQLENIRRRLPLLTKHMKFVPGDLDAVSSTEVRKAVRARDLATLHSLVLCEAVEKYLIERISPIYEERDRMAQ